MSIYILLHLYKGSSIKSLSVLGMGAKVLKNGFISKKFMSNLDE